MLLEIKIYFEGWESEKKKKKHGNHVIEDYIKECNRHGAIPVSYFQRHIHDRKFIMKYYGLGPLGAKAIAKPLEVCFFLLFVY